MLSTKASRASRTAGWTIASSAASFSGSESTICARQSRSSVPSARSREKLADLLDEPAARALELPHDRVGVEHRHPGASNILRRSTLPMPIEPVSAILIMTQQSSFAKRAQERNQRHAEDGEMVALYALEQLHSAALQPEDADSVADLRPLRIQI
jgi:hypothetical protein